MPNHPNNVAPNITGGYLLEWDFRKGADYNVTAGTRGWVGVKEPEDSTRGRLTKGISQQQNNYINGYLDQTDAALFGSSFKDN